MQDDWQRLSAAQLDWNYDQRQHAPNMALILERLAACSRHARARHRPHRLAYGQGPSEAIDWYASGAAHAPVLVFIHGGAWRSGQACDYAFFVEWVMQQGMDVVIPDFSAVTEVNGDLGVLYRQVSQALRCVVESVPSAQTPVHLCGHSSGAHLAACLAASPDFAGRLASLTACSGIYDLAPVSQSSRSQYVRFTPAVMEALSPIRHTHRIEVPTTVLCGTNESPEFQRQARAFHKWLEAAQVASTLVMAEGLNHFEMLETLALPDGLLASWVGKAWKTQTHQAGA